MLTTVDAIPPPKVGQKIEPKRLAASCAVCFLEQLGKLGLLWTRVTSCMMWFVALRKRFIPFWGRVARYRDRKLNFYAL